jgi:hypothetical protein
MPTPTFYVHLLNPDAQALGQAGLFTGAATADDTAVTTVVDINISVAEASKYFLFKSDSVLSGDEDAATIDVVGVDYAGTAAWTFPAAGVAAADELASAFLPLLAEKVFGSASAVDLFSNGSAVVTSWHAAAASAKGSLNAKTSTAVTSAAASKELIDAMFFNNLAGRFAMDYKAGSLTAKTPATGVDVTAVSGSGSGAKLNLSTTGLSVHTAGTGYAAGDSISITNVTAFTINSVQAAMLNGKLSDAAGTAVPLEIDDKIRVIYQINSATAQKDASDETLVVPVIQKFKVDYKLIA